MALYTSLDKYIVGNPAPSVRGCVGNPTLIAICP